MGYETKCRVRVEEMAGAVREAESATVLLETDELIVRGPARIRVPRTSITAVTSRGATVTISSPAATITMTLAGEPAARTWERKLAEAPKPVIDKLGVKPGMTVWCWGVTDGPLVAQVKARAGRFPDGRSARDCDVVIVQVDHERSLMRIDRAAQAITASGAIWVVHPKGASGVADTVIFGRARAVGLTYVKVARISDTLTAEKLVRPKGARG